MTNVIRDFRDRHGLSLRELARVLGQEDGTRRHLRAIIAGQREPSQALVDRTRAISSLPADAIAELKQKD